MNLGIFLGIGESLSQMEKSGQKDRFINLYLKRYIKDFDNVYLFSYADESYPLPKKIILVPKKSFLHRYLYAFLLPIINYKQVKDCDVVRGFGLTSAVPGFLLTKPFVFNWPYDYHQFLKIEKKYLLIPPFYILEKLAFAKAKKVFIATRQKVKSQKASKFIYTPNGVDLKIFKGQNLIGKGLVFVGRFEMQKNLFFLIDAVSRLPKNERRITFIGSGSKKKKLKKYASKKSVLLRILPPVGNLKLPKLLNKFSIFTLPSLIEGSPKVLLEAMALGLVPVVTNFPTAKEVIINSQNGFITDYDVNVYSNCLEELLSDDILLRKISQNAKQSIVEDFNLEKLIASETKVLKQATR